MNRMSLRECRVSSSRRGSAHSLRAMAWGSAAGAAGREGPPRAGGSPTPKGSEFPGRERDGAGESPHPTSGSPAARASSPVPVLLVNNAHERRRRPPLGRAGCRPALGHPARVPLLPLRAQKAPRDPAHRAPHAPARPGRPDPARGARGASPALRPPRVVVTSGSPLAACPAAAGSVRPGACGSQSPPQLPAAAAPFSGSGSDVTAGAERRRGAGEREGPPPSPPPPPGPAPPCGALRPDPGLAGS